MHVKQAPRASRLVGGPKALRAPPRMQRIGLSPQPAGGVRSRQLQPKSHPGQPMGCPEYAGWYLPGRIGMLWSASAAEASERMPQQGRESRRVLTGRLAAVPVGGLRGPCHHDSSWHDESAALRPKELGSVRARTCANGGDRGSGAGRARKRSSRPAMLESLRVRNFRGFQDPARR